MNSQRDYKKSAVILLAAVAIIWLLASYIQDAGQKSNKGEGRAAPVEVAAVERGAIELRRTYTGTLEAEAEFVVAPRVSGRIEQLGVDIADIVTQGQVVAQLDNAEYVQAERQAKAELAVAQANLAEAKSQLRLAQKELQRTEDLRKRSVISDSQVDTAKAAQLASQAHVKVTEAQVIQAEAELEAARIRLGYTEVKAGWRGDDAQRVVAERYVDEGQTVSANAPLLRIVELDPIKAVFFVSEKEYARLQVGQRALLATDAYANELFEGAIVRIAPVFRESTRQARVELRVNNTDLRLKPGMFVRATLVLQRIEDTTIVPEPALVKRDDRDGVFVVSEDGATVSWREVQAGIREGNRVQVIADALGGRVVVLGQQLLDDGATIVIANPEADTEDQPGNNP